MQTYKKIKAVALDLDGTTFNSKGELTERTVRALETAAEQGVHIIISTGRSYNSLPSAIKAVRGISYAITSNGAHINDAHTGQSLYDNYLSDVAVDSVIDISTKHNIGIEVFIDGQAYIDAALYRDIQINGSEFRNAEYVLWSRKPVEDIYELLRLNRDKIENVNFCFNGTEHLESHRSEIERIPQATIASSFKNNLEVGGATTSKKTALAELLRRLNITPEELMCCGDAPNDIQMLEFAGLGVAMGNAWGDTKEHADYVTGTNDEDGVAQAVEKFVL